MNLKYRLQQNVLFPFLLPVFFVLHTSRYYFGAIPLVGAIGVTLLYLTITTAIFVIIRKGSRHAIGAGLATALIMCLYIYWEEIIRRLNRFLRTENYTHLPVVIALWILTALLLGRLINRRPDKVRQKATTYFNLLLLLYIAFECVMTGVAAWKDYRDPPMIVRTDAVNDAALAPHGHSPNVYLLLMDEYASSPSLKEDWGFDNSYIDSALMSRGFHISPGSRSNYQLTVFSMATMLNMDYLDTVLHNHEIDYRQYALFQQWLYNPRVIRNFRRAGYVFENLSIFEIAGQPKPELGDILVNRSHLLTINGFYHAFITHYLPYLQHRREQKMNPNYHDPAFYKMDNYNKQRLKAFFTVTRTHSSQPKFVYLHLESPHPPFYYDSLGNYLPVEAAKAATAAGSVPAYRNNVRKVNTMLAGMVDTIMKNEGGNAVILVLGDHGFRTGRPVRRADEQFRNYNAIYYPDRNYHAIPGDITNVNVFRVVFNKLFGTRYPLLPNRCITLHEQQK